MKLIKRFVSFLLAALASSLGASAYTLNRVSVHDPSIVWEPTTQTYYIFGSFREDAKTTDLMNWTAFTAPWGTASSADATNADAFTTNQNTTFGGGKNYNAYAWASAIATNSINGTIWGSIDGNMWAPDVIWNPTMNKWCMYLSLNGVQWNSCIILLTADNIEGPYTYQAPVVYSGFNVTNADATSYKNTDLELALGEQSALPERYAVGNSWGTFWPHCIDPCVFYDESGKLWMSYGSWSGGIFMLELDETTGLRDYNVSYAESDTSDPYFGKKIAGGYYSSGEASYIEYINGYYYLFLSYGGLQAGGVADNPNYGGYQMRVFRSTSPDGPYTDPMGNSAIYTSYKKNFGANCTVRGENIFGCYGDWGYLTNDYYSERSQGHNSIIAAPDGRTYLVYHTRFQNRNEFHEVRVHQVFQNEEGWLVAAPFEYTGETVTSEQISTTQQINTADIPGHYKLLVHRNGLDHTKKEMVTPVEIQLHSNGSISGEYNGTWTNTEGTSYVQITLSNTTYKGVMAEQAMEPTNEKVIAFTAMANNDGVSIWGHKFTPADAVPTPVYFNDFSSSEGLEIIGSGKFVEDADAKFGMIYHNDPNLSKAIRTNYLKLPSDVLMHSATSKEMTISFWVNKKNAADYYWSPIFTAYGSDNGTTDHNETFYPFFFAETRGVLGWNSNGYCDFTDAQNDAGKNTARTDWSDDGEWHLYTMTFTPSSARVYIDGSVLNSWTIAENGLDGLFTQTNLVYVCLGGNQAWGWNDPDPAFGFDDFAVYDVALTAEQIEKIIEDKKNTTNPTPVYFNDFASSDGLTIMGSGEFVEDQEESFGRVYQNDPEVTKAVRTNYLLLPASVLTHSGSTKEMTIGFWVNAKNAKDFWSSPIFTAYENNAKAGSTESWPMFAAWAGGTIQSNCWGWCNFEGAQNDNGTNAYDTFWMDDKLWHYYTITLTTTKAVVYIDGVVKNSWTVSGGEGQNIEGIFSGGAANALAYVCLGGNQPWNQNEIDPAFAFDDFAVYDVALTAEQIAKIIADKSPSRTPKYSVTASYGGKTKTLASGTGDKNANVTVAYPRYIQDGSTLYEAATNENKYSKTFTLSYNNQEVVITYDATTISNVYYYAEAEDVISGATSDLATASNGKLGGRKKDSSSYTNLVPLPAGAWQIVTSVYVGNSGNHTVNFKVGDEVKWTFTRSGSSQWYEATSDNIILTETAMVSVAVDGGQATGIDWIYIKSAEPTETVGAKEFSTAYLGALSSNHTLKKGDTMVFSFCNHSNKQENWNNWIIKVKEGDADKAITRADFWDVILNHHLDSDGDDFVDDWALMSTDGGTTKIGVDWEKYKEDMADALVVATLTYAEDGALTINAVSTGMKNGYKYYVDNVGHITCTGDLTVNLSVDYSWLEIFSVQNSTIELADDGSASSNAAVLTENDGKTRNVRLDGRTLFKDGDWNTLCLPFNLGNAEAEAGHHFDGTLLEGATVMTLASTNFNGSTLTMNFADATSIEAGKPYIVKWTTTGDNIVNPLFNGVSVSDDDPVDITSDYASFCGTYSKLAYTEDTPDILFLGAKNTLYYPQSGASVGACRAYFQLIGLTAGNIAQARLFFGDDTTGIVQLTKEPESEGPDSWYSLDGRRLTGKPARSGIYMKNGRKVVLP